MSYNDINIYTYFTKPYAYGWMVYHIENRVEVMDDCFVNEETAKQVANSRNMREAQRVADAKERMDNSRKNMVIRTSPYYSITGYFGD